MPAPRIFYSICLGEYSGIHIRVVRSKGNPKTSDFPIKFYQVLWHCKTVTAPQSGSELDNAKIPDTGKQTNQGVCFLRNIGFQHSGITVS